MPAQDIRRAALDFLARREHSLVELRQKLGRRFSQESELMETVLARLVEENLQSDLRFTENFTHHRKGQGYGPVRIRQELGERGVAETIIEQQLAQEEEFWQEGLTALWQKRFGAPPKDYVEQAKQARFLQYRGFVWDQIKVLFQENT